MWKDFKKIFKTLFCLENTIWLIGCLIGMGIEIALIYLVMWLTMGFL